MTNYVPILKLSTPQSHAYVVSLVEGYSSLGPYSKGDTTAQLLSIVIMRLRISQLIICRHQLIIIVIYACNLSQMMNNWVSGSPPMLYKLVLGLIPIVHKKFQENPLTTLGISIHFKII